MKSKNVETLIRETEDLRYFVRFDVDAAEDLVPNSLSAAGPSVFSDNALINPPSRP